MFPSGHTRERLSQHWRQYLIQALLCTISLLVIFILLQESNIVVVSSLGATAFIVFAMPRSRAARFTATVNGHVIGLLCGMLFVILPQDGPLLTALIYAGAVGATFLVMLLSGYRHPPAAGTAMGILDAGFSAYVILAVLFSVVGLSMLRIVFLQYLQDFEPTSN